MTAINENGQIYWTFDELDLQGTLNELCELHQAAAKKFKDHNYVLMVLVEKHGWNNPVIKDLDQMSDNYYYEQKKLYEVISLVRGLINYGK